MTARGNYGAAISLRVATRSVITGRSLDGDASVGHLAWLNRHAAWPVTYAEAAAAAEPLDDPAAPLAAVLLCARRLQHAFAWRLLDSLCESALPEYPADADLLVHQAAARAATTDSFDDWGALAEAAELDRLRWGADFLAVAVVAPSCEPDIRRRALAIAEVGAANGEHVPAYQAVSLLRLLGHPAEAWTALKLAEELLAVTPPYQSLFEHLSERLLVERMLLGPLPRPLNA